MKKCLSYLIPALLSVIAVTIIFTGYFLYEYRANIAYGIWAPIGVSLCFLCFFAAGIICLSKGRYNAAIVLAVVKYALLFIGTMFVFRHTLAGLSLGVILGFAIPIFLPIALTMFAIRFLVLFMLLVIYVGIIAEPIILSVYGKSINNGSEKGSANSGKK